MKDRIIEIANRLEAISLESNRLALEARALASELKQVNATQQADATEVRSAGTHQSEKNGLLIGNRVEIINSYRNKKRYQRDAYPHHKESSNPKG